MVRSSVADLTVNELRQLIKETVAQAISEAFSDPDEGLGLREDIQIRLRNSLQAARGGVKTRSAAEVAAELGLEW
jgi:hypothetical protein